MSPRQHWTRRLALAVVVVSLLPIGMGALTTTLGAGMAFLDWPTSDGENMLLYDMLRDVRLGHTDKVAEHGHRLAGVLIGLLSIALVAVGWNDGRPGLRRLTLAVLLGVIGQGVLGGVRVRLDSTALAMAHGLFGAGVFALMGITALVSSPRWTRLRTVGPAVPAGLDCGDAELGRHSRPYGAERPSSSLVALSLLVPFLIMGQYVAGGFVRHFGTAIPEHLGGAAIVAVAALAAAMLTVQSGLRPLRPFGWGLFAAVLFQVLLGFGAWAGKFGIAALGIVAVQGAPFQVALRSLHTIGGMALLAAAVLLAVAVLRMRRSCVAANDESSEPAAPARNESERRPRGVAVAGGAL